MLLILSGKLLVGDRGQTKTTYKANDPLPFEKYISGDQTVHGDDDYRVFVAMSST